MQVVQTHEREISHKMQGKKEPGDEYRIVQYPDPSDTDLSRKVFFVDKKVKRKFLFFFTRTDWETVKFTEGKRAGESMFWHSFKNCSNDVQRMKKGEKIIR